MNATYQEALKFNIRDAMNTSVHDYMGDMAPYCPSGSECLLPDSVPQMFSYLSWIGAEVPFATGQAIPLPQSEGKNPITPFINAMERFRTNLRTSDDFAIGVAVFPRAMSYYGGIYGGIYAGQNLWTNNTLIDEMIENATLITCKVKPLKYSLRFTHEGISQNQKVQLISATELPEAGYGARIWVNSSDAGIKFGPSLFPDDEEMHDLTTDESRQTLLAWSSMSVLESFASLIVGAQNQIVKAPGTASLYGLQSDHATIKTQVFSTVLADTIELAQVSKTSSDHTALNTTYPDGSPEVADHQALSVTQPRNTTVPTMRLADALEELFFNMTISFASSEKLSPLAPPPVNVTYKTYANIYAYEPSKLWLAYGLAIAVTTLNVIVGLCSIFQTGASFTANFSSIVRIAKNASIDASLTERHMPGKDPCPKNVAEAQLTVYPGKYQEEEWRARKFGDDLSYKPVQQSVREVASEDGEGDGLRVR